MSIHTNFFYQDQIRSNWARRNHEDTRIRKVNRLGIKYAVKKLKTRRDRAPFISEFAPLMPGAR